MPFAELLIVCFVSAPGSLQSGQEKAAGGAGRTYFGQPIMTCVIAA